MFYVEDHVKMHVYIPPAVKENEKMTGGPAVRGI
jgi:hypothetical protein